jgi:NAD(P)H dehydrogenase (quinone)
MRNALIPAITGAQSSAIASALTRHNWHVTGVSRSDGDDQQTKLTSAHTLILTIPQDHRPGAMTGFVEKWVFAAKATRIERIILNLGGIPASSNADPLSADLHAAQEMVVTSGLPFVVLQPTIYLDNLAAPWAAEGLAANMIAYPAAPEVKISWMSHKTLGDWVAAVATGDFDGRVVKIGGPEALTGLELAREISNGLGREMNYVFIPPAGFAGGLNAAMGAPAGDRIASIYARLAEFPTSLYADATEAVHRGVELETARSFASRVLA